MDIKDIKKEKIKLEFQILELIDKFGKKTKVDVVEIQLTKHDTIYTGSGDYYTLKTLIDLN